MPPKASPTHFLSLQLTSAHLARSLIAFHADVTRPDSFAIPHDAIRPPGTMHLTLGVMNLNKQDSLCQEATSLLRRLQPRHILSDLRNNKRKGSSSPSSSLATSGLQDGSSTGGDGGLRISLRGLHSMHGTCPSRTSVLYASPADVEGILYPFCEELRRPFREAGFIVDERPLVLHATVVNTIYVRGQDGSRERERGTRRSRGRRERLMLDARALMERYGGCDWVEDMPVTKVALCRMGARKVDGGDEVYEVESEIEI
ncbi:hypothetical protein E4U21_006340 [Claviceps maximensis]|nr:hypothetical protein E4U21_006340 [Claviceps maximensis]